MGKYAQGQLVFVLMVSDGTKLVPAKGITRIVTKDSDETTQGVQIPIKERDFSTGSRGFHGQAKVELDGVTASYQTQMQLVEIGSKKLGVTAKHVAKATTDNARNTAELGVENTQNAVTSGAPIGSYEDFVAYQKWAYNQAKQAKSPKS